jgi:hypothetical protein
MENEQEIPIEIKQAIELMSLDMFVESIFRSFQHPLTFFYLKEEGWASGEGDFNEAGFTLPKEDVIFYCVTTPESTPESVVASLWTRYLASH